MEIFIKCKGSQNVEHNETGANPNHSQPVSISISASIVIHISSDFVIPKLIEGPEYITVKILFSTFLCFILVPFLVIWFSPNIHLYIEQQVRSKVPILQKRFNRVTPTVSIT
jgi:hypothetical protein